MLPNIAPAHGKAHSPVEAKRAFVENLPPRAAGACLGGGDVAASAPFRTAIRLGGFR